MKLSKKGKAHVRNMLDKLSVSLITDQPVDKSVVEVWRDEPEVDPDFDDDMAQKAIRTGIITVYSSYPIEIGTFVTPSVLEAQSYSGDGRIYSKEVKLTDVAWIDSTQGQYAPI